MKKRVIDLEKVREGDRHLARARELNPNVRMPTLDDLQEITGTRPPGRPRGPEPTVSIAVRVPESLKDRLDRHLDRLETQTGLKANRATICRHALQVYLDAQDQEGQAPKAPKAPTRRKQP
jgi:hypothetical protein